MIFDISERSKAMNDKSSNEWVRLPMRCLKDNDLTLSDIIVLSVIVDYIDGESKAMSNKRIAEKTGLTERQVIASIKKLIATEYITAEKRAGKKTIYTQCEVLPPKRQPKQKKEQAKKSSSSYDDDFDVEEYKEFINDIPEYGRLNLNEQQAK